MKQPLLFILIVAVGHLAGAQSISNVTSIQQGNNALITYDLNGSTGSTYFVKVYYSTDGGQNFSSELTQVSGDIKSAVKPGPGKKIVWAADKEVNYLNGSVVFKVVAEAGKAMPKPVTAENITVEVTKAKRISDQIIVEFIITQNSDVEIREYRLRRTSQLASLDGRQFLAKTSKLGAYAVVNDYSERVACIKGIPVKGELTFAVDNNDVVIPAIKIDLFDHAFHKLEIPVKNIPIE